MMNKQRKTRKIAHMALVCIMSIFMFISGRGYSPASADSEYTDVLDDLEAAENFDISEYPKGNLSDMGKDKFYSLQVINIAESVDGELFIYVYRPSGGAVDLPATSIRMSNTVGNSYSPRDYALRRLSSSGTLEKYVVEEFTVKSDLLRYYDIICIFRAWNKDIDDDAGHDNTVSEVPYKVGKAYVATTVNGEVSFTCTEIETIEIKDKFVGYVNYSDGTTLNWGGVTGAYTSAHFVAFDTNKSIDKLMSAEVQFKEQSVSCKYCCNIAHIQHELKTFYDYTYGTPTVHEPIILNASDKAFNQGGGNINVGNTYEWNRIQKTSEFLADKKNDGMKLKDDVVTAFAQTKWVLNFYETAITVKGLDDLWVKLSIPLVGTMFIDDPETRMTRVSDVTLLRLEFETDGEVYNLGVVDNKQTGSKDPIGVIGGETPEWVWWLIGGIALIVILIVIVAVLPNGINVLITIITALGKGVFIIVSLPFRLIYWIVDSISNRKGGDE